MKLTTVCDGSLVVDSGQFPISESYMSSLVRRARCLISRAGSSHAVQCELLAVRCARAPSWHYTIVLLFQQFNCKLAFLTVFTLLNN